MLHNISRELSVLLAAKKIISIENIDVYAYGLELFLFKLFFYFIVLILAFVTNAFWVSILFLMMFLGLRQYSGGYHCKTSGMCIVVSLLIYLIFVGIYIFQINEIALALEILSVFSFAVIALFAPVDNENKVLGQDEKKKYHAKSVVFSLVILMLSLIGFLMDFYWLFYPSSYAMTATAIMILISLGRCNNEKNFFKSFSHRS